MNVSKINFKDSEGNNLVGILDKVAANENIIILLHGFTSTKERGVARLAEGLNKNNFNTFRFDFFGHGESDGKLEDLTCSKMVDGTLKAIELLKKEGFSNFGIIGSSMGGAVALGIASQSNDIKALATKAGVADYPEHYKYKFGEEFVKKWEETGFAEIPDEGDLFGLKYDFYKDSLKYIDSNIAGKIKIPTLIIHGDKDMEVNIAQSKGLHKLIPHSELKIIEGADHFFRDEISGRTLISEMVKFFQENSFK